MNNEKVQEIKANFSVKCQNVGIFIDFDNVYYSLKNYGINMEDEEYCIFTLMNLLYSFDKIRTMRAYADFDQVSISFKYLQGKRVQIKNVYGNGLQEEHRKNASDIELSIDALDAYYRDSNIDTFVFITSDSDMIPIMSRLIFKGKKVHLYYIEENTSHYQNLTGFCHEKFDLLDLLKIDKNRKNPSYWVNNATNEITAWYNNPKNFGKLLGGNWLNELFCEKLLLSRQASSNLIKHLEENNIIEEVKQNNHNGYKLKSSQEEPKQEKTAEKTIKQNT